MLLIPQYCKVNYHTFDRHIKERLIPRDEIDTKTFEKICNIFYIAVNKLFRFTKPVKRVEFL